MPYAIDGWGRASNDDLPFEKYLSRRSQESDGGGEAIKEIAAAIDDVDFVCRVVTFLLAEVASNVRDTLKVTHVDGMRSRLDESELTVQVDASSWRGAVTPLQHYACWLGARTAGIEPENARQTQFPDASSDLINDVLGSALFVDRQYAVKADVWRTTIEPLAVSH